jgi:hypothetical protein
MEGVPDVDCWRDNACQDVTIENGRRRGPWLDDEPVDEPGWGGFCAAARSRADSGR